MRDRWVGRSWTVAALLAASSLVASSRPIQPPHARAVRLTTNPLITVASAPSLGDNVDGPTVIRVPDWVERPMGRYYMYFAHHWGTHIRLAYADAIGGPWRVHEPGVLHVKDTGLHRPQPDPDGPIRAEFYTHVASPEILIDHERRRIVMWVHGYWTNGERWPGELQAAEAWLRKNGYGQFTQVADSIDGLRFDVKPAITRTSYLRVFQYRDMYYGMSRLGRLSRSTRVMEAFELGPNPFREGPYAGRVRHLALRQQASRLLVFFSAIGDAPERLMLSTIDLTGEWTEWKASPAVEVLRPETAYECADLPIVPSTAGGVVSRVRELRDPYLFEDGPELYLIYSICGEQGIAAARLTLE